MAITSGSRSESPLDGICLSASEKAAVLTLIREEVRPGSGPGPLPRCGGSGAGSGVGGAPGARPQGLVSAASQIITKEIEANEWKKKYEESRQEVLEMR